MAKRYMHNPGEHTMFVGSVMIPAGEGREVDEQFLPPVDDAAQSAGDAGGEGSGEGGGEGNAPQNLVALQALPVRDLVPQLEGLSAEDLAALEALEQGAETPRVTVLSAITKLQLDRAQAAGGGAPT